MDNSYFSTPPFWGGAEDYGSSKMPSLPLPRPKFRAPAFGNDRTAMVPVMDEEDALPSLPAPIEGPKPLSEPRTPAWTTSDEIRETLKQQPKLERAKGWKGALQAVGDVFINPELMHPKYSQQVRDYEQKLGSLSALKKMEDQDAEAERRRMVAEAQMASDKSTEALRNRQLAKLDEPVQPKRSPLINTADGIYDPNRGEWINNPNAPKKEGKETPAEATARREADADRYGLKGPARTEYILTGKMPRAKTGGSGGSAAMSPANARIIEGEKARALSAAEKAAKEQVAELRENRTLWSKGASGAFAPDDSKMKPELDRIYGELEKQKQQIQNDYEAKIAASGGNPSHFEYPAPAKPKPKAPAAADPSPVPAQSPGKPVRVMDPKTGEVRSFQSLSAEEIADAKSKGYQVLD